MVEWNLHVFIMSIRNDFILRKYNIYHTCNSIDAAILFMKCIRYSLNPPTEGGFMRNFTGQSMSPNKNIND